MTPEAVFGYVGPRHSPRAYRGEPVIRLPIDASRRVGTFFSDVGALRRACGPQWRPAAFDLLNIMCTLRAADRYFPSQGWGQYTREVRILATVLQSRRWRKLTPRFRSAVFQLSRDRLSFVPVRIRGGRPAESFPLQQATLELPDHYEPDCVCLFSGGADSFAGLTHLLAAGRCPLAIAHSQGPISKRQQELFSAVREVFPHVPPAALIQLRAYPRAVSRGTRPLPHQWRQRDNLQRLRSMFFLSVAAIIANARGLRDVFMCENGVIASAVAWEPAFDTPYTTRPAEPNYLRAMQEFVRGALEDSKLTIRNPFQYSTKGEVIRACAQRGFAQVLPDTVSCWRAGNRGIRNCGVCVPCMFRQLAFDEARLTGAISSRDVHIGRKNWRSWASENLDRLAAVQRYCTRVLGAGGATDLRSSDLAVVDAVDVTCGNEAGAAVDAPAQAALDEIAPERTARVIERFAKFIVKRLPE